MSGRVAGLGYATLSVTALGVMGENGGQAGYFLWLGWIVYASVSLARGRGAPAVEAAAVATSRGYVPSAR